MNVLKTLQQKTSEINIEIYALYLAYKDANVVWYARFLFALALVYAISPIDLITDFVPVLGYMDDLIIVPAAIYASLQLIPEQVMRRSHDAAINTYYSNKKDHTDELTVISAAWVLTAALVFLFIYKFTNPSIF